MPARARRARARSASARALCLARANPCLETAIVWWASDERLGKLIRIEGLEHLGGAGAGQGAMSSSPRTSRHSKWVARALCPPWADGHHVQMPKNQLIAELSLRGRTRRTQRARDLQCQRARAVEKSPGESGAVWYWRPINATSARAGAVVPFSGIPPPPTSRLRASPAFPGAPVLPYFPSVALTVPVT